MVVCHLSTLSLPVGKSACCSRSLIIPCRPISAAVVGGVDSGDAVVVQFFDFVGEDGAATAAEDFNVAAALLFEEVVHVFEEFHVPALVAGDGDGLGVFLNGPYRQYLVRCGRDLNG